MAAASDYAAYARGTPSKKEVIQCAARGDLILYDDAHGRVYAFSPESVGGVSPTEEMLDAGYAYVVLATRRGLTHDTTEEELGARAAPDPDTTARITLRNRAKQTAMQYNYPRALDVHIHAVYRAEYRATALIECTTARVDAT